MTCLCINVVDHLYGIVQPASMDRVADGDALSDAVDVLGRADVGLLGELFSGARVAFGDEVVHDDPVDITVNAVSVKGHRQHI